MFQKGSKLYSVLKMICPRCNEGQFFKNKFTYNPNKVIALEEKCSKCKLKYMMEPSFYFGAMYVNYGLSVALFVGVFIISNLFFGLSILHSFITIIIISLILIPVTLRFSRIIWIHMFVNYDKDILK